MIKAASSSGTSVHLYLTMWHYISEDSIHFSCLQISSIFIISTLLAFGIRSYRVMMISVLANNAVSLIRVNECKAYQEAIYRLGSGWFMGDDGLTGFGVDCTANQ